MPIRLDSIQSLSGSKVINFNSSGVGDSLIVNNISLLSSLKFPQWTEETKPEVSNIGNFGFNTETNSLEIYNGEGWISFAGIVKGNIFPTAYQSLIDTFSGTKIYVKTTGSDSNSGTSENSSKATIQGAISSAVSGSMIIVYPGNYVNNTSGNASGSSYSGQLLTDEAKNLQIVCAPGQVKLSGSNSGARDFHAIGFRNSNSKIYGAILERNNGARTNNYSNAFIGFSAGEGISVTGQINNCVIRETNANGQWSMHYDNSGSANWISQGCLFIGSSWIGNYSGGGSTTTRFSASNNSSWTTSGTFTGNQRPVTIASNWGVGSTAYGVYYGTYAWDPNIITINYT